MSSPFGAALALPIVEQEATMAIFSMFVIAALIGSVSIVAARAGLSLTLAALGKTSIPRS
jgi:hypothetical protein